MSKSPTKSRRAKAARAQTKIRAESYAPISGQGVLQAFEQLLRFYQQRRMIVPDRVIRF